MDDQQALREIMKSLGRLEGQVETVITGQSELWQAHNRNGGRIDVLESKHDKQKGAFAVLGVIAGIIGSVVTLVLKAF